MAESELLWHTASPYEVPLVMAPWARSNALLAAAIDAGYELRRNAGLPTDRMPDLPPVAQVYVSAPDSREWTHVGSCRY